MKLLLLSCSALFVCNLNAQLASTYSSDVANKYFGFTLKLTKESPGFTPPVASRAFGYTGLTLYEATVPGIPSNISLVNKLPQFLTITSPGSGAVLHWPTVVNNALAGIIDSLWANATQVNKDSLMTIKNTYNLLFQSQISASIYADSKAFGENIANDIFQYSKSDGAHEGYNTNFPTSYVPPSGAGLWVPLAGQIALQPEWGETRPFVLDNSVSTIPGPPPAFSTTVGSTFFNYANDVYTQSTNNTPGQVIIAQYWADGGGTITPPGHSMAMLRNIMIHENANLETAAIQYAKMGMALTDAFIACWKTKFLYNCIRPIGFINDNIDPNWVPLVSTPPFPEYSSGHSSQSGAMEVILESYVGTSYSFIDSAHGSNFGGPRSFNTISEAAEEAAISRLYGGIHYEFGNNIGLATGRAVGANIDSLFNLVTLSVDEVEDLAYVQIYPNPAENEMNILISGIDNYSIEVYNVMGQKMNFERMAANKIDVSNLSPGLYHLNVLDTKQNKLVIKNFVKK
ncbi:MAG: T9SS type A sorting domain-containing protein [Bacteroidota bacterium]